MMAFLCVGVQASYIQSYPMANAAVNSARSCSNWDVRLDQAMDATAGLTRK
jgi:hypothetical protein